MKNLLVLLSVLFFSCSASLQIKSLTKSELVGKYELMSFERSVVGTVVLSSNRISHYDGAMEINKSGEIRQVIVINGDKSTGFLRIIQYKESSIIVENKNGVRFEFFVDFEGNMIHFFYDTVVMDKEGVQFPVLNIDVWNKRR